MNDVGNPLTVPKHDEKLDTLKERSGCLPDASGRRPMGCADDGWSNPSPYASLAQRAFGDDSPVHDTGDCDQSTPWGCPYGGELHKK